ncbi:hypothetical protein M514_05611 [Trichuris suis]|uniref:Uncharacterized protein n=1 Tax=Trichuris suis TaxID=68888 RepID=A0A085NQS8_9BILA|nr:hypothetical protein M513_05611 [Trichuris suis]KFD71824.1 hypothetical protein M514_05611 [Trichuris suis]
MLYNSKFLSRDMTSRMKMLQMTFCDESFAQWPDATVTESRTFADESDAYMTGVRPGGGNKLNVAKGVNESYTRKTRFVKCLRSCTVLLEIFERSKQTEEGSFAFMNLSLQELNPCEVFEIMSIRDFEFQKFVHSRF